MRQDFLSGLSWLGQRRLRLLAGLVIAVTIGFAAGLVAFAGFIGSQGDIQACYNNATGALRVAVSSCTPTESAVSWEQGGGVHGIQEFNATDKTKTWAAPPRIYHVMLEVFGAGGGGGLGATGTSNCYSGGAGGGGGYARGVVTVTPGLTYIVTVGTGGKAATNSSSAGAGGVSGLTTNGSIYAIKATGGQGGTSATSSTPGKGGTGGAGFSGTILRNGTRGGDGSSYSCGFPFTAFPGTSYEGTVDHYSSGGSGGASAAPTRGVDGYVILNW